MKIKFSELTIKQVTDICKRNDRDHNCPFQDSDLLCDAVSSLICTDLDKEIDLPDELAESDSISSSKAVRSLGEYDLCDQWVCPNCGIEIQDYVEIERDEDDGEEVRHEYCPKFCPECGRRIIDPDEEVKDDAEVH